MVVYASQHKMLTIVEAMRCVFGLQYFVEGYYYPLTAPMPLYPEFSLDSLPHVDYGIRKAVAEALFRQAASASLQLWQ